MPRGVSRQLPLQTVGIARQCGRLVLGTLAASSHFAKWLRKMSAMHTAREGVGRLCCMQQLNALQQDRNIWCKLFDHNMLRCGEARLWFFEFCKYLRQNWLKTGS